VTATPDSEPLPLDKAAKLLGWVNDHRAPSGGRTVRAEKLLDAIRARERETGLPILTELPRGKRTTLRVTMHALREHLSELFPGPGTLMAERGAFQTMLSRIRANLAERYEDHEERLTKLEHSHDVTREMVLDVAELVEEASRPDPSRQALRTGPDRDTERNTK